MLRIWSGGLPARYFTPLKRPGFFGVQPRYSRQRRPTAVIVGDSESVLVYLYLEPSEVCTESRNFSAFFKVAAGRLSWAICALLRAMICQPTTEVSPDSCLGS